MRYNLLCLTSAATLAAGGAFAQDAAPPAAPLEPAPPAAVQELEPPALVDMTAHLASQMLGESVYDGVDADAQKLGDVKDLVVDETGTVKMVVIGVGGFLGIGEKNVALDYGGFKWAEQAGDRWLIVSVSREQLEMMPEFDRTAFEPDLAVDPVPTQ